MDCATVSLTPITPMLNVQDIEKTIEWYKCLGFTVAQTNQLFCPEDPINWAYLKHDGASLMLNLQDKSNHEAGSVTFYMKTDRVDELYRELKPKVKIVEDIRDQFYGMRDFYFEDCNGFKFGIGQQISKEDNG